MRTPTREKKKKRKEWYYNTGLPFLQSAGLSQQRFCRVIKEYEKTTHTLILICRESCIFCFFELTFRQRELRLMDSLQVSSMLLVQFLGMQLHATQRSWFSQVPIEFMPLFTSEQMHHLYTETGLKHKRGKKDIHWQIYPAIYWAGELKRR